MVKVKNNKIFLVGFSVVGGLISAHLLSKKAGMDLEPAWPCEGPFLRLAVDVAKRLLPGELLLCSIYFTIIIM